MKLFWEEDEQYERGRIGTKEISGEIVRMGRWV
jgi:hypothetical protein